MSGVVEAWFGDAFVQLHPQLQALHRSGGALTGSVRLDFAPGIAGVIGRRIARTLGIPVAASSDLEVCIYSDADALHWNRRFAAEPTFNSVFAPVGRYPEGHWIEKSGNLRVVLGVSVVDGAWHWVHRQTRLWGIPLPRWLAPRTIAHKEILGGGYLFKVAVVAPLFGTVMSYAGALSQTSPLSPDNVAAVSAMEPHGSPR